MIAFCTLVAMPAFADCRSALNGRELVWAWNEWVPYAYAGESDKPLGFDVDLVSRILDDAGCPYRFVNQPAKRAQQGLRDGSVDMMAAASITPERELFSRFSEAYRDERIVLFVLAGRAEALGGLTLDDAAERRLHLAAGLGGWYGKTYETHSADLQKAGLLLLTGDLEGRLRMLGSGRVDLVIEDQVAGIATARQLGLEHRLAVLPNPMNSDPVSLMFSRQSVPAEVVTLIDQAIERQKQSPDYQQIVAQYTRLSN
ncbi:MAG: transporter substrate-binding domain-containing protein [Proteobacteria bacterium]|nr:transporter substrate-binding domain-containing protein [Pseudomonadota bacterium]